MSGYAIQTKQLTKRYDKQIAVNKVNLHVSAGKIYGLLGRNGAGKTTIMKMLMGLTEKTSGEIVIFDKMFRKGERDIYSRIGCMIEAPAFYPNLTGTENLRVMAKLRGVTRKDAIKKALGTTGLPFNDNKTFSQYSLGMKQRLAIANAIMHEPELLFLDEPTNGLDAIGIAEMRKLIKEMSTIQGKTILISSHILSEIALLADDIGVIHHGTLLEESSFSDLEKKNRKYLLFQVSQIAKASNILEQKFGLTNYSVEDNQYIRIYSFDVDIAEINRVFALNDIAVSGIQTRTDSLEDYFKKITGGAGIA
ncbi:ABC transporter ATP-binding protein [Anaerocolumna sp.]|uniref:ABC transporter ATP-binding protein n=1 Tax=Anaerocolumna sp. TaxID=2041569 RepID=UPI0028A9BCC6|nr:ATP-binding cassette domain-containing protein [Anaerocolumna sp.]